MSINSHRVHNSPTMNIFKKPVDAERNLQASLYVGNLDPQVTEPLLYELFIQFGPVKLLNLPKDRILRAHQGFGFVEYRTVQDADYALNILRGVRLFGRTLKMKKTELHTTSVAPGEAPLMSVGARLFVRNLSPLIDEQYLQETFSRFGTLIERPTLIREDGVSKGHAFLEFDSFEASDAVVEKMDGALLMNYKVSVTYAYKDDKRVKHGDEVERLLAEKAKANLKKPGKVVKSRKRR